VSAAAGRALFYYRLRMPTARTLVIPMYREASRIGSTLAALAGSVLNDPATEVVLVDDGSDDERVMAVEGRQLTDRRPHHRPTLLPIAPHIQDVDHVQPDRDRQLVDVFVGPQQLVHRDRTDRVDLVDGPGLRGSQRAGQLLGTGTEAHLDEVVVGMPPLPHPSTANERPQ